MKKILITGADGFVGKELTALLKSEDYFVLTTDLKGEVDLIGDLSDSSFVKKLPDVEVIINCAAVQYTTKNIPFIRRKEFFRKNNIQSIDNLKERYKDSLFHFIQIGSSMMYKQSGEELSEASPFSCQGIYSFSKVESQKVISDLNCKSSTIIPCIIAGSGRIGFFPLFISLIKKYKIAFIPGNKDLKISLVHVKDVCLLIKEVIDKEVEGLFNAAAQDSSSISDWALLAAQEMKLKVKQIKLPICFFTLIGYFSCYRILSREQILMISHAHILNIEKSKQIGWLPRYNYKDILKEMVNNLK